MGVFFVRRLVGGAVQIFLAGFLLYALLVPSFISSIQNSLGIADFVSPQLKAAIHQHNVNLVMKMYAFDKPWPINYLTWLFNPGGTQIDPSPFGIDNSVWAIAYVDFGVLTGDFGYSANLEPGTPVLAVVGLDGPGLPLLLSVPFATILFFMSIVALQRRGRPTVYSFTTGDNPVRKVWRHAELWPLS